MNNKTRVIAFYLPQFHPIPENDEWWGKGFTEWTNVGKAKPLFRNHYQPRVPADLGYYDLRLPIVREQQVELAREAGVHGFCYWHYWFGNGKRLMESIFDEVLSTGKPDFPFCLGWANHSWYAKNWNADGSVDKKRVLIEQFYPGIEDVQMHFDYLVKAFRDPRYIKVNNKPILYVFDSINLPQFYIDTLQKLSKDAGFQDGIFFVGNFFKKKASKVLLNNGYSAVSYERLAKGKFHKYNFFQKALYVIIGFCKKVILNYPLFTTDYKKALIIDPVFDSQNCVIPAIIPCWDHTPRSGKNGSILLNSTPNLFKQQVSLALRTIANKPDELKILFLKSWNEWAEGNYMEPDLKFGKGYIKALKEALEETVN